VTDDGQIFLAVARNRRYDNARLSGWRCDLCYSRRSRR